jgi:uncharacterized protein (DUF1697 family)
MPAYVAFLRAVNVAGHGKVAMADLQHAVAGLGFQDVRTVLQSGNVVFRGVARPTAALERALEAQAAKRLDLRTAFIVRTDRELAGIVAENPFPNEAERDPGHLVVMFLRGAPSASAVQGLQAASRGPEVIRVSGRQLYVVYPDGIGRSKLTLALIERHLATQATGRNWNTVRKLAALLLP